ncbi:MAG: hypothetical protein ACLP0B_13550 [Steroidobacteraceae bacterium]
MSESFCHYTPQSNPEPVDIVVSVIYRAAMELKNLGAVIEHAVAGALPEENRQCQK